MDRMTRGQPNGLIAMGGGLVFVCACLCVVVFLGFPLTEANLEPTPTWPATWTPTAQPVRSWSMPTRAQTLLKPATATPTSSAGAEEQTVYHTVRQGETLATIAKRHHTTGPRILELNHIPNPDLIKVDQRLVIYVRRDWTPPSPTPHPSPTQPP